MVVEVRSETAPPRRVRKTKWAFHKAEWQAFAADCEQSLAELEPDLTTQNGARRAAELEKKATIAHFKDFVSTTLNRPANVGRVHKTLKKWERCCDDEPRDGQAMLKGDRLIVTDRDKAEAFVQEYARVSKQVRIPKLDRDTKRQLREEHRSCRGSASGLADRSRTASADSSSKCKTDGIGPSPDVQTHQKAPPPRSTCWSRMTSRAPMTWLTIASYV
ncbi:hypothetical protein FJT64_009814 [Amphibalanus amphitrite]|uniref:Uncharacterized protein n=1 Tax=Amphibalanus amphitrite TaxID=1232801 RepID=A0A6A4VG40_AMPAM|nr:hypothetical protein FJT64_009814 [Amphibalanus amphitrite]